MTGLEIRINNGADKIEAGRRAGRVDLATTRRRRRVWSDDQRATGRCAPDMRVTFIADPPRLPATSQYAAEASSSVEPCCFRLCEELGSCPRSVVEDCRNCGAAKSPKQNKYGVAQKTRRNINSREKRSNIPTKTSVYKTPLKCSDSICGSYLVGVPYLVQCEEVQLLEHLNIASTRIHKPTMALKINKSTTIINTS